MAKADGLPPIAEHAAQMFASVVDAWVIQNLGLTGAVPKLEGISLASSEGTNNVPNVTVPDVEIKL